MPGAAHLAFRDLERCVVGDGALARRPRPRPGGGRGVGWVLVVAPAPLAVTLSGTARVVPTGTAAGALLLGTATAGFHDLAISRRHDLLTDTRVRQYVNG